LLGHYWTFNVRAVLRAISVRCFYHAALLSHDAGQRAWIGVSFEIFHCRFSLDLPRGFCVPRHFPLRTDRRIVGFLSVILKGWVGPPTTRNKQHEHHSDTSDSGNCSVLDYLVFQTFHDGFQIIEISNNCSIINKVAHSLSQ
jgi:hypothetical protein